jgi:hypothetical protein
VPVHANLVERERKWSRLKLDATVVPYQRRSRSCREVGILRVDGGEVALQTGLDCGAVVTAAAATHQQHSNERQSPHNRQESRHLTASDASLTRRDLSERGSFKKK